MIRNLETLIFDIHQRNESGLSCENTAYKGRYHVIICADIPFLDPCS